MIQYYGVKHKHTSMSLLHKTGKAIVENYYIETIRKRYLGPHNNTNKTVLSFIP